MPLIPADELQKLRKAIYDHDFLHRILRKIEHLHKVIFHAQDMDWKHVRAAAEEILIAEIVTRHAGNIDGVYFSLRKDEDEGREWQQAVVSYATYIHNYYTTPLGIVLRKDLFGDESHFVTPVAGAAAR